MTDTLEAHGIRWRFNDLLDPEEWVPESQWAEADLTAAHLAELKTWLDEHLAARPQDTRDFARWSLLEHNGVQHTHRRGRPFYPERPALGYECRICRGGIFIKEPGDSRFVGGPAHGQWHVTDGGPYWRVPIIERVSFSATSDAMAPSMARVATYRRERDVYVFESAS